MAYDEEIEKIEDLSKLPDTLEDFNKQPLLRPLTEFNKHAKSLSKDERIESTDLEQKKNEIKEMMDTGIYKDSLIATKFLELKNVFERYLLVLSKYSELADDKILQMKKVVEKYYITKEEHAKEVSRINKSLDELEEENSNLKKQLNQQKKNNVEEVEEEKPPKKKKANKKKEDEEFEDEIDSFFKKRKEDKE